MKRLFIIAAALMMAVSCSEYNDSELRGRVDELEDRVESHEQWLAQLQSAVNSLNDANKAFTTLLNGGVITDVQKVSENGVDGYKFMVKMLVNGTLQDPAEEYTVWNGQNGTPGDAGDAGKSPELTVEQDEDGRWYWVLDGEALTGDDGGYVYATGDNGNDGVTPDIMIATGDEAPNDKDTGDMSWWVSTDGKKADDNTKTWTKLDVFYGDVTVTSGVTMEVSDDGKKVTFRQGEEEWTYEVSEEVEVAGITISVEAEDIRFYKGETKEYEFTVEGAEEYIVKAEHWENNGAFDAVVEDGVIYVTANKIGVKGTIEVEVVEKDGTCKHTYFEVVADVPTVYLTDNNASKIIVLSEAEEKDKVAIYINTDLPESDELALVATKTGDDADVFECNVGYMHDDNVIWGGEAGKKAAYTYVVYDINAENLTKNKLYNTTITFSAQEGKRVHFQNNVSTVKIADELERITVTYTSPYTLEGSIEGLQSLSSEDGTEGGSNQEWWGSYYGGTPTTYPKEYGTYIDAEFDKDVDLFQFRWLIRVANHNACPMKIDVYISNDKTNWTKVDVTYTTTTYEDWKWCYTSYCETVEDAKYARFSVMETNYDSNNQLHVPYVGLQELWVKGLYK